METREYRQRVPRPETTQPGALPSWVDWAARRTAPIDVETVHRAFLGRHAHEAELPPISAVLAPLYDLSGEAHLVLTRRAHTLTRDPGLISLPGGRIDPDEPAERAAIREAYEEVGITRSDLDFVGPLPIAHRRFDGQVVAPFVGLLADRPTYTVNEAEVDAILEIPLTGLFTPGVAWQEVWERDGRKHEMRFFADPDLLGDDIVWGLTARIMWDLLECIAQGL